MQEQHTKGQSIELNLVAFVMYQLQRLWTEMQEQHTKAVCDEAPAMLEALRRIAFEPIGHPEASPAQVLIQIADEARAIIAKIES